MRKVLLCSGFVVVLLLFRSFVVVCGGFVVVVVWWCCVGVGKYGQFIWWSGMFDRFVVPPLWVCCSFVVLLWVVLYLWWSWESLEVVL